MRSVICTVSLVSFGVRLPSTYKNDNRLVVCNEKYIIFKPASLDCMGSLGFDIDQIDWSVSMEHFETL